MRTRNQRNLLRLFAGALALACVASAWWLMTPPAPPGATSELSARATASPDSGATQVRGTYTPLAEMRQAADIRLHRPLYDPPPVVKVEEKFVPPPLRIKLAGTITGGSEPQAMLEGPRMQITLAAVGDTVHDAQIVAIHSDHVIVTYYGQEVRLDRDDRGDRR